jgi:transcription antitermination protein NusB
MSADTKPVRKSASKSGRSRAREFALQGLYQYLVGRNEAADIDVFTRDLSGFHKSDSVHLDEISPIEHAVMWMGVYEFQHCIDVPWRVVLNEYIELAKSFGGTDGHKYVNAVLNSLAPKLRSTEVQSDRRSESAAPTSAA